MTHMAGNYLKHFYSTDLFSKSLDMIPETPSDSNLERTIPSRHSRFPQDGTDTEEVGTDIEEEGLGMYDWLVRFCCLASGYTRGI